jgi:hypothetical protein
MRLVVVVGTLLGPEETTCSGFGGLVCFFWSRTWRTLLDRVMPSWVGVVAVGVVAGCVFVENCTVDASIFVVKLLRAHGGCLGTRSR